MSLWSMVPVPFLGRLGSTCAGLVGLPGWGGLNGLACMIPMVIDLMIGN